MARVFVRELCGRNGALVASVAPRCAVPRYGVFAITPRNPGVDPHTLTAILNSRLMARYVRSNCDGVLKESFNRIRVGDLRRLPIPLALVEGHLAEHLATISRIMANSQASRKDIVATIDEVVSEAYEMNA
jgi:hypothetical protein